MMEQFKKIKEEYADAILFFRVGDFYEMFFEDAVTAAKELEIALTSRNNSDEEEVPLAGIPFHSAPNYISKFLEKGYKVAICEQVEDASQAKGLVKREVTRVITPGTKIEESLLDEDQNNYLSSISKSKDKAVFGLTFVEVSTGEVQVYYFKGELAAEKIMDEILRLKPTEIVIDENAKNDPLLQGLLQKQPYFFLINEVSSFSGEEEALEILKDQFGKEMVANSSFESVPAAAVFSLASALKYINNTQKASLGHLRKINLVKSDNTMNLDAITVRNLEISEKIRQQENSKTLFKVLNKTRTAMGGRLLRKWLERPLVDSKDINTRLEAVEELRNNLLLREEMGELLKNVYDLERLSSRINLRMVTPRDLLALKKTLGIFPQFKTLLKDLYSSLLQGLVEGIPDFSPLTRELEEAIDENAPFTLKEGGIFKEGYHEEIDRLRSLSRDSKQWMAELERQEREKTGIKSLKIGYNRVFGYYIEVTKPNLPYVPEEYIRKQTLVNAERFITQELKEKEDLILNSEERLGQLEYELFEEIREKIADYTEQLQTTAQILATLDCLYSFAESASSYGYIKPELTEEGKILIKGARHPVVERTQEEPFIPNEAYLDREDDRTIIITGPNMAGKSTYCRSIALLLVMAQAGSFVPADEMLFSPLERIFTRIGASDDLSAGRSTFMVEMEEVATILKNATSRSLIVMDEIGRGTSTYDGMSLAKSILEYLQQKVNAMVLFSTHYHELTSLENEMKGIRNYTVQVKEKGEEIIFLRKVVPGKADKSYGINVARLADLPEEVVSRAGEILYQLESQPNESPGEKPMLTDTMSFPEVPQGQLSLFPPGKEEDTSKPNKTEQKVLKNIKELNLVNITPLKALNKLFSLQNQLLGNKKDSKEKD